MITEKNLVLEMTESKNETYMSWLIVTQKNGKLFSVWKNLDVVNTNRAQYYFVYSTEEFLQ